MIQPITTLNTTGQQLIDDIIRGLAAQGVAIMVVSSELEEVEALCHRVILLHDGEMIGELRGEEIKKDAILHTLLAGDRRDSALI